MTWEEAFSSWAQPPGKTEQDRCSNAEKAVRNAISSSDKLKNRNIKVFTQGSYRNNTNVKQDSDVDIVSLSRSDGDNTSTAEGLIIRVRSYDQQVFHISRMICALIRVVKRRPK